MSVEKRILSRVSPEPNSGCWLWVGKVNYSGYATDNVPIGNGKHKSPLIHRVSYEHFAGPIPHGLVLDHLCRVRCCVNPRHLEPVTQSENLRRGVYTDHKGRQLFIRKAAEVGQKTHCVHGHEFTPENIYSPPSRPRERQCKQCHMIWSKDRKR